MQDENYRLTGLLNFKAFTKDRLLNEPEMSFISRNADPSLNIKSINWLNANGNLAPLEIMMPDGTMKKGYGEGELKKLKEGTIVRFNRFGYCRLHKKQKDRLEFWFTQK
jgi:hypothetical protein